MQEALFAEKADGGKEAMRRHGKSCDSWLRYIDGNLECTCANKTCLGYFGGHLDFHLLEEVGLVRKAV